jgi:hypothetical protein
LCLPTFSHFLIANKTSHTVSAHWYSGWQPEALEVCVYYCRTYYKERYKAVEVLSDMKHVLQDDADLALNFEKSKILVPGISAADAHAAAQHMLNADPSLAHLRPVLSPASFVVDGYIGLGVPIGTDAFIQHFVQDKCHAVMEDVDKLDNIQDVSSTLPLPPREQLCKLNTQCSPPHPASLSSECGESLCHMDSTVCFFVLCIRHWFNSVPGPETCGNEPGDFLSTRSPLL